MINDVIVFLYEEDKHFVSNSIASDVNELAVSEQCV